MFAGMVTYREIFFSNIPIQGILLILLTLAFCEAMTKATCN